MPTSDTVNEKLATLQAWVTAGVAFVVIAVLSLSGVMVWLSFTTGHQAAELVASNQARLADIQAQRLFTCRQTYEGVRQVFQPFLTPRSEQTKEQRQNIKKFNETVDRLKRSCTTAPPTP